MNENRPTLRDASRVLNDTETYKEPWERYLAEKAEAEERLLKGRAIIDAQAGKVQKRVKL